MIESGKNLRTRGESSSSARVSIDELKFASFVYCSSFFAIVNVLAVRLVLC